MSGKIRKKPSISKSNGAIQKLKDAIKKLEDQNTRLRTEINASKKNKNKINLNIKKLKKIHTNESTINIMKNQIRFIKKTIKLK